MTESISSFFLEKLDFGLLEEKKRWVSYKNYYSSRFSRKETINRPQHPVKPNTTALTSGHPDRKPLISILEAIIPQNLWAVVPSIDGETES